MYLLDFGELILLDQVVARLDHNVVLIAEDGGDLVCNPLLHQVDVDLLNVDFLIKLRRELGCPEAFLINAKRHIYGAGGECVCTRKTGVSW